MSPPAGADAARIRPVRMGEMVASRAPHEVLTIVGLGSCIALILIDPGKPAAAMAHIVLPESRMTGGREAPAAKFADTAVPALIDAMRKLGIKQEGMYAVLIGGATMFGLRPGSRLAGVGDRNAEAVAGLLKAAEIPVTGRDLGGENGRSVQVFVGEGRVVTKSGVDRPFDIGGVPGHDAKGDRKTATAQRGTETFQNDIWASSADGRLTA